MQPPTPSPLSQKGHPLILTNPPLEIKVLSITALPFWKFGRSEGAHYVILFEKKTNL